SGATPAPRIETNESELQTLCPSGRGEPSRNVIRPGGRLQHPPGCATARESELSLDAWRIGGRRRCTPSTDRATIAASLAAWPIHSRRGVLRLAPIGQPSRAGGGLSDSRLTRRPARSTDRTPVAPGRAVVRLGALAAPNRTHVSKPTGRLSDWVHIGRPFAQPSGKHARLSDWCLRGAAAERRTRTLLQHPTGGIAAQAVPTPAPEATSFVN